MIEALGGPIKSESYMSQYIKLLSDISFMTGIIGYSEYCERCKVADWLIDTDDRDADPRISNPEGKPANPESDYSNENANKDEVDGTSKSESNEPPWFELLMMNQWMFTIGDRDCYPSVPHGHYKSKTREWPKLNPYTGRVFSDMHKEETGKRLDKKDMKMLWNDSKFIEHCRGQVLWYRNFAPKYGFPRARHGKLVFPRWR